MKANIKTIIEKIVSGDWGKEDVDNIGVKIIRTTNFTNAGNIDYDNIVTRIISEKNIQEKRLKKGDIIIEKSGGSPNQPVGRVVYFSDDDTEPILCNNFTSVIRCKNDVNSRYAFYYLYLNWCRGGTRKYQNKTTGILNLKLEKYLDDLNIELPSKEEQDNIVSILDKADEIRTKKRLANDKLDEFLKSTFISMFGDPRTNNKNWHMNTLEGIVANDKHSIKRGPFGGSLKKEIFKDSGYLVYEQTHAIHNNYKFARYYIDERKYKEMEMFKVIPGDLIISCSGVTLGRISEIPQNAVAGIINQALLKISLNHEIINNEYFISLFRDRFTQNKLFEISRGSGIPNLPSVAVLKELQFMLPPIDLQNKYSQIVKKVEAQKQKNEQVIEQMDNLFNSLSQRAFKGEL